MKKVSIRKGREDAIRRRSPWVFSGAVFSEEEGLADGAVVRVMDFQDRQLGVGHYQAGSIRVRLLEFGEGDWDEEALRARLAGAVALRGQLGLNDDPLTNAYRLVHAAGDGLPGLIVDRYASVLVVQCHSIGMHRERARIAEILPELLGKDITTVYDKSAGTLPERYATEDGLISGENITGVVVLENGRRFRVDVAGGQKTGFFLDQRENRWLLGSYAKGKSVLNTFCYTGGFSVYAALGGASRVDSVDLSAPAVALTRQNVAANLEDNGLHQAHAADVMDWLKEHGGERQYDIIVVDPPAFAKNKHKRHKAVQAYKRLNARAIRSLRPGGLLFTFSCSRVVDRQLFYNTIVAAGLEADRPARVLHHLSQGPDHPVSLFHAEGSYLKGLVLRVD